MTHHTSFILAAACASLLAGCSGMGVVRPGAGGGQSAQGQPAQPSENLWQQARARGMVFRAVGIDPPWEVDVSKGHAPTLFVNLNNGAQQFTVPAVAVSADQSTGTIYFRGATANHPDVEMTVRRGQCQGDMGNDKANAAVTLVLGARALAGCGRFLF